MMLGMLYGALTLLLITAVECGAISASGALLFGLTFTVFQFVFGPWILDLTLRFLYTARWVDKSELPEHLQAFVQRVCEEEGIRFPSFAIIDDGAPQAYTYGHYPNNARIVLSRGTLSLLSPQESEAVVAHELGHVCHWDMVVMTIAQIVPLIAYAIYRAAQSFGEDDRKGKSAGAAIAFGAYIVYIVSELVVLWFSRVREYYADQFAGEKTRDPNALSRALITIGYGLANNGAQDARVAQQSEKGSRYAYGGALGALNIFDRKSALGLVVSTGAVGQGEGIHKERVKDALQWDLWNPWALYYEVQSTHPLIAKRLERLSDQAASMRQEPYIVFDRTQPESYWDEFFVDLIVMVLPMLGLVLGGGLILLAFTGSSFRPGFFGVPLLLFGAGLLIKTSRAYRSSEYPNRSIADLLREVKVSPVRTIPVTVRGTVIGKGVPGLIYSEDFVMRDETGIIFLDYRQPIPLWDFFFGLLKAGRYQGKEVEVTGWYRRAPVPYLELASIRAADETQPRRCYTYVMKLMCAALSLGAGVFVLVAW
jgi:Zn-dependent protease with chaperone function